jgi:HD-GYP domain-containing protein (c-di-GMP phosphodiesterase class II)
MRSDVERVLYDLTALIQSGKIYSDNHPLLSESKKKAFDNLFALLEEKGELVFGVVEGELAWGDEILFDLSDRLRSVINFFQRRGIERIRFESGITEEEFYRFLAFMNKFEAGGDISFEDLLRKSGLAHIRAGRIRAASETAKQEALADRSTVTSPYQCTLDSFTGSVDQILRREELNYLDLRFNILTVMESFMGSHHELLNLITIKRKDLSTFLHLLNVSILSMFLSSRLGFSRDDCLDIGVAALFHDIGKIAISRKILLKPSRLAEKEFARMKDHTRLGATILLNYRNSLGIHPAVVAYEHHMRFDLTGYPKPAFPIRPHVASLIVSICDVYDALAQCRTYKRDYPPDRIFQTMDKEKGALFDPELLDRFFQIVGVWPIGTIVRLSDDRVAVVRSVNEKDIFNPRIEVIDAKRTGEKIDLSNHALEIREALNPFQNGRPFLDILQSSK